MKKKILVFAVLALITVFLASCGDAGNAPTEPASDPAGIPTLNVDPMNTTAALETTAVLETTAAPDTMKIPETTAETAAVETYPFYRSDVECFEIETPYGVLLYPKKWQESCSVELSEGNPYVASFNAVLNGDRVKLFDFCFGDVPENGTPLGKMPYNGSELTVSLVDYGETILEKYPETDYPDLYMMSEDMNEVISGLVYNNGLQIG